VKGVSMPDFQSYLFPANINRTRCVDERQALNNTNGVQIPGGIYGIIDAIKHVSGVTEEDAWKRAHDAGIPIDGHIDEHHGAKGCGYARLVEEEPQTVLAPESVEAQKRLEKIQKAGGSVLTLLGDHHPTHALINHKENFSLDPIKATQDGFGIFNFDMWAAKKFGEKLNLNSDEFASHLETVYKHTVTKLTGITEFSDIS